MDGPGGGGPMVTGESNEGPLAPTAHGPDLDAAQTIP